MLVQVTYVTFIEELLIKFFKMIFRAQKGQTVCSITNRSKLSVSSKLNNSAMNYVRAWNLESVVYDQHIVREN